MLLSEPSVVLNMLREPSPRSEVTNDDAQQLEYETTAYDKQQGDCNYIGQPAVFEECHDMYATTHKAKTC